jgi:hypothetical protein
VKPRKEKIMTTTTQLKWSLAIALVLEATTTLAVPMAEASASCRFSTTKKVITLENDCTTNTTITIPDGFTLDGKGHLITVVDPDAANSNYFSGPVITNSLGARTVYVKNVIVDSPNLAVQALSAYCNQVYGILFQSVSGTISGNTLLHIGTPHDLGCDGPNGVGIQIQNLTASQHHVTIENNKVLLVNGFGILAGTGNDGQALSIDILNNELSIVGGVATDAIIFFAYNGGTIQGNNIDMIGGLQGFAAVIGYSQPPGPISPIKVLSNNINLVSGAAGWHGGGIKIESPGNEISNNRIFSIGAIYTENGTEGIYDMSTGNNSITNNEIRCYSEAMYLEGGDLLSHNKVLPCPF